MKQNPWPYGIIAFFIIIAAVNATLVTFAARGYGGMLDQHPYAKGLEYDVRKAQLEAFKNSGWRAALRIAPVALRITGKDGEAIGGAQVALRAIRPNNHEQDRELSLNYNGTDTYLSSEELSSGRWMLDISIEREGRTYRIDQSILTDRFGESAL